MKTFNPDLKQNPTPDKHIPADVLLSTELSSDSESGLANEKNLELRHQFDSILSQAILSFVTTIQNLIVEYGGFTTDNLKVALSNQMSEAPHTVHQNTAKELLDFVSNNYDSFRSMDPETLEEFVKSFG